LRHRARLRVRNNIWARLRIRIRNRINIWTRLRAKVRLRARLRIRARWRRTGRTITASFGTLRIAPGRSGRRENKMTFIMDLGIAISITRKRDTFARIFGIAANIWRSKMRGMDGRIRFRSMLRVPVVRSWSVSNWVVRMRFWDVNNLFWDRFLGSWVVNNRFWLWLRVVCSRNWLLWRWTRDSSFCTQWDESKDNENESKDKWLFHF
jgi:hypothetical protein